MAFIEIFLVQVDVQRTPSTTERRERIGGMADAG
jgi:hypothetical protein